MKVDSVNRVSFQANIPKALKTELFDVAHKRGGTACTDYLNQVKKVESWGMDTSSITVDRYTVPTANVLAYEQLSVTKSVLKLINSYFAPFKKVEFKQKENLFDTFMSLTERDIINAENKLKI